MRDITLNLSETHRDRVPDVLKLLVGQAEVKENHIDRLRQMNFSMALFVFAGLVGFGLSQDSLVVQVSVVLVVTAFMVVLSDYDHSLHKYLHGWRRTKEDHLASFATVINTSPPDITINTYSKGGEDKAVEEDCRSVKNLLRFITKRAPAGSRIPSRMRVVYYLLVRGAVASLVPFLLIGERVSG